MLNPFCRTLFTTWLLTLPAALSAAEPGARLPSEAGQTRQSGFASAKAVLGSWYRDALAPFAQREAVQMMSAVLAGSQMSSGEGWFHPGQSRYGWEWLISKYDANQDGVITQAEFEGPADSFERLDRDGDGDLKPDDFDWSDRSPFMRQQGTANQLFARIDRSSNGRISSEEWQKAFEKLAGKKAYLTREDLRAALFPPPPRPEIMAMMMREGPSQTTLLKGIFSGELGSMCEGPAIGKQAPDFELETEDGKRKIRLADFRGQKPVVLIFGSFT